MPTAAMLAALFCCALAPAATQFQGAPYSVTLSHLTHVGQQCTGSTPVPLAHDSPCMLTVSVHQLGDEVLTLGGAASGGPTLSTAYKITGIADGDPDWVDSTSFLSRTYSVPGNNVTDNLTLSVQGAAPANRAPDPGDYTATIVLTVTF